MKSKRRTKPAAVIPSHPVPVPDPPPVPPGEREEVRRLRASLDATIASKLTSGSELIRALAKQRRDDVLPTTIEPLDVLLGGGLARGKMTEIAGRGARFSIVMATLAAATSIGEAAALIDVGDGFDPQLAAAAGVDLRRLLWIRPRTLKQAVTAAEMIGATGFQLVVLDVGPRRPSVGSQESEARNGRLRVSKRVPDAAWVRLARIAESHGCTILVSAPFALTGTTSEAMVLAHAPYAHWLGRGNSPRILAGIETRLRLEKHRRLRPGHTVNVSFRAEEAVQHGSGELGVGGRRSEGVAHQISDTPHPTPHSLIDSHLRPPHSPLQAVS